MRSKTAQIPETTRKRSQGPGKIGQPSNKNLTNKQKYDSYTSHYETYLANLNEIVNVFESCGNTFDNDELDIKQPSNKLTYKASARLMSMKPDGHRRYLANLVGLLCTYLASIHQCSEKVRRTPPGKISCLLDDDNKLITFINQDAIDKSMNAAVLLGECIRAIISFNNKKPRAPVIKRRAFTELLGNCRDVLIEYIRNTLDDDVKNQRKAKDLFINTLSQQYVSRESVKAILDYLSKLDKIKYYKKVFSDALGYDIFNKLKDKFTENTARTGYKYVNTPDMAKKASYYGRITSDTIDKAKRGNTKDGSFTRMIKQMESTKVPGKVDDKGIPNYKTAEEPANVMKTLKTTKTNVINKLQTMIEQLTPNEENMEFEEKMSMKDKRKYVSNYSSSIAYKKKVEGLRKQLELISDNKSKIGGITTTSIASIIVEKVSNDDNNDYIYYEDDSDNYEQIINMNKEHLFELNGIWDAIVSFSDKYIKSKLQKEEKKKYNRKLKKK